MDLDPTAEQRMLIAAFADLYADLAPPAAVAAAEPLGHSPALWEQLKQTGAVEMAVPEQRGGGGASLLDLALVAEQHGRHVAPAPLIEAQVAARLLARLPGSADSEPGAGSSAVDQVLADVLASRRLVTLGLRPVFGSRAELVPAGAIADDAILLVGDRLLLVPLAGRATAVNNLGCLPLADVDLTSIDDATVLAEGADALTAVATAVDEWRALTAAALSGLSRRALEIGVSYVKERKAFGKLLGSFQGVAHLLADRATEVDGSELLSREAAWAAEEDPARAADLAAMALGFAAETARDTSYYALHFHGGYGFMLEYPIQMYYRRARSWAAVLENPQASYRRVADLERGRNTTLERAS